MPAIAALIIIAALLFLSAPLQAFANEEAAQAAESLIDSGAGKLERGDLDGAIADLREALELAWTSEDAYLVGNAYRYLGIGLLRNGDVENGQTALDSSLQIFELAGEGNQMLLTLRAAVALCRNLGLRELTIHYLNRTADLYELVGAFDKQGAVLEQVLNELKLPDDIEMLRDVLLRMQAAYEKAGNEAGVADTWAGLGRFKQMTGDVEGALVEYAKAIEVYRRYENRRPLLGNVLNQSAEILRREGRYQQALPLQEEALAMARESGYEADVAESLNNLALVNQELGNHPRAAELIEESLVLTRKLGNKENLATALVNAASIYRDVGRFDEGIALLQEVFKMANEDEGLEEERRNAGHILATIYHAQGDPLAAAAAAMAADSLAEREGVDVPGEDGMQSHNFAISLIGLGKYEEAIEILDTELKTATDKNDLLGMAHAHEGLAGAYEASDRYTRAVGHMLETIRIRDELGDIRGQARSVANLAVIYLKVGRYYDALDRYDEVSRILATRDAPRMEIETLLSMGQAYRHLKLYRPALNKAERALLLSREHSFSAQAASALRAMALLNLHIGDYAESERLYRAAESESESVRRSVINDGLVEVFLAAGRYQEALEELSGVTSEDLVGAPGGYRLQYYTQHGIASYGAGQVNAALADFSRAMNESEKIRRQFAGLDSQGFFDAGSYGGRIRPYRGAVEVLATNAVAGAKGTVTIGAEEHDLISAAFHFGETMRGRNLLERMAQLEYLEVRHAMPAEVQEREKALNDRLIKLAAEVARKDEAGEELSMAELEAFDRLRAELRAHLAMLRKDYPQYALLFSPSTISIDDVPAGEKEAVLEFVFGLDSVFLFVIRRDEPAWLLRLPVTVADLQIKVQVFRDLLVSKRYEAGLGHELYRILLSDAIKHVGQEDALVIVPDGILGLLPFEALVTDLDEAGSAGTFLGSRRRISYAQSASLLTIRRNSTRASASKNFFGLGDPIFGPGDPRYQALMRRIETEGSDRAGATSGGRAGRSYKRLPETRLEVAALAAMNKVATRPPDVLVGKNANETSLRDVDLGAYRVLHFATHAEALGIPGRVNEPFLVLNQVGNDTDVDGLLTMKEIMELRLNSDLVVLAACDTGGGDVFEGDGVASLASAFQFAGSQSVLLSLWKVPSRATLYFMRDFYSHLQAGRSQGEALYLSREKMRQRYPDPYYWAVFVLYSGNRQ